MGQLWAGCWGTHPHFKTELPQQQAEWIALAPESSPPPSIEQRGHLASKAPTEHGGHPSHAAPRTLHDGVPSRGGLGGGGAGRGGGPRKAQHTVLQTLHEGGGAGQGGAPGSSASSAGSNGGSAARAMRQSKAQPARNVIKAENLPHACSAHMSTPGDAKRTRGRRGEEARRRGRQGRRGERGEESQRGTRFRTVPSARGRPPQYSHG